MHAFSLAVSMHTPLLHGHHRPIEPVTEIVSPRRIAKPEPFRIPRSPGSFVRDEKKAELALRISVILNIAISIVKLVATIVSGSLAVTATLVDSILDVLSQFILFYTDSAAKSHDGRNYPVGRTRMAPLGIFVCAVLMGMASMEVVRESVVKLTDVWNESTSEDDLNLSGIVLWSMAFSFIAKFSLYIYCNRVYKVTSNDSVKAVALDHLNDVLSIAAATAAALASAHSASLNWVDPVSAIAISIYIMSEWWDTAKEQANMLVGKAASEEFLKDVRQMANNHHQDMQVDVIRAYHFGPKYLVELEVVLPPNMTLETTHDIGMTLQHKVEAFEEVERAFVHIDYMERDYDEHRPESWPDHYVEKVSRVA